MSNHSQVKKGIVKEIVKYFKLTWSDKSTTIAELTGYN